MVACAVVGIVLGVNHASAAPDYYADIQIQDYGTVTVELDADAAPITVENFVNLARSGFYDGLTFHRIMDGFMMQGGDPEGNGTGGSDWMFYLRNYAVVLLLGILFSMPVLNRLADRFPRFTRALATPFLMLVLVLSVAYLVDSTYNPFLYFRF